MVKRKQEEDKLITATQVAEIWNKRAKEMGYPDTHYTRFSVRQRRNAKKSSFRPVIETDVGGLYHEGDAWSIPIYPERSRRDKHKEQDKGQKS